MVSPMQNQPIISNNRKNKAVDTMICPCYKYIIRAGPDGDFEREGPV
jgi:hypothetical protein